MLTDILILLSPTLAAAIFLLYRHLRPEAPTGAHVSYGEKNKPTSHQRVEPPLQGVGGDKDPRA